jgi:hypothetical protein
MRNVLGFSVAAGFAALLALGACGDEDSLVRPRSDAGIDAAFEAGPDAAPQPTVLACGTTVPSDYDNSAFVTNAAAEIVLRNSLMALSAKMKTAEGATPATVSTAELTAIFTGGAPSVRSIATAYAQATVDAYLVQFGEAVGHTWTPALAEADGGSTIGGRYAEASVFSATGVDLREGTEKTLINGALYNYALLLTSGAVTPATVDRLLALYGASPKFAARTDADAGADGDELIAEYAAKRDDKASAVPGPYRKIRTALLVAKAAAGNPVACKTELAEALKTFFFEWEKSAYLTVIYYLNRAATNALASPQVGPSALHGFGEAAGFVQSFKGIAQDRRRITDAQIDALLSRIGAQTPYQLITRTAERVGQFNLAFQDIGAIYGLTQLDIEEAKKAR